MTVPAEGLSAVSADVTLLGSDARREIVGFLATGEKTIAEIAKGLGMHPATLRYHLGLLLRQGLVQDRRPQGTHERGRPAIRYRASRHATVPAFPPRRYELLAATALETLLEVLGPERASDELARRGLVVGESVIAGLAGRVGDRGWDPEAFERILLGEVFREFGIATKVLSRGPSEITYRSFTCPFLELAERVPKLVCDSMDAGVHMGIDRGVGSTTERLACMGHGDAYCEYRVRWSGRARSDRGRKEVALHAE